MPDTLAEAADEWGSRPLPGYQSDINEDVSSHPPPLFDLGGDRHVEKAINYLTNCLDCGAKDVWGYERTREAVIHAVQRYV